MDHPEPISKPRQMEIPQCRKGFTLVEARAFVDDVMATFHSLEDMSDLRMMYETGKQLSRAYFDCHQYRAELAQHLTALDYPAFASKMMKKLNNMGVFKNDDIWFSSFYFYNTTWNFSDTWPELATALAVAGLPNLLNLNIGHQPYLENLSSKNVYYLIKASLSIIHNIARVPGNTHHFAADSVKQALLHLSQREEDFLRCVSILCLAYIVGETETSLLTVIPSHPLVSTGTLDSLHLLLGYIITARISDKRRCHGFQVAELLAALASLSTNDSIKTSLLIATISKVGFPGIREIPNTNYISVLKEIIEVYVSTQIATGGQSGRTNAISASPVLTAREAEEAIRVVWSLVLDPGLNSNGLLGQLGPGWPAELLESLEETAVANQRVGMIRALQLIAHRLTTAAGQTTRHPEVKKPTESGYILVSYASAHETAALKIYDRLLAANLPVYMPRHASSFAVPISAADAAAFGLSALSANSSSQTAYLDLVRRAGVVVVCVGEAYRLSPGCRFELDLVTSAGLTGDRQSRTVIPVVLQAKYRPTGWLATALPGRPMIDLSGRRDPEPSYEALLSQLAEICADAQRHLGPLETIASAVAAQASAVVASTTSSVAQPGIRVAGIGGDTIDGHLEAHTGQVNHTGVPDARLSHICGNLAGLSIGAAGAAIAGTGSGPASLARDHSLPPIPAMDLKAAAAAYNLPAMLSLPISQRCLAVAAWRRAVRPEVRAWSTSKTAAWFKFRGLSQITSQTSGGIDGILLSQLAGLRLWAPEFFAHSLRTELGLSFTDSLRLLEALDELVPEDHETGKLEDHDDMDAHSHASGLEAGHT
ncbi:unnamed protein product [Protopolystoma xenopodis]|uniref:TIR domain-containing protein n=1 Tax=Protopolystoma xenopodis TaxID=117903 RepID=A0A3S5CB71_9PLAT|nr:unnamed protein product [Protopolystoma xenopodis]